MGQIISFEGMYFMVNFNCPAPSFLNFSSLEFSYLFLACTDLSEPVLTCPELEQKLSRVGLSVHPIGLSVCHSDFSGRPISFTGSPIGLSGGNKNKANAAQLKLEFGLSLAKVDKKI